MAAVGHPVCNLDAALVEGARQHMTDVMQAAVSSNSDAMDYLRFSLYIAGASDYVVTPFRVAPGPQGDEAFLVFIRAHDGEWTHCGVGAASKDENSEVLWIGVRRRIMAAPIPVKIQPGDRLSLGLTETGRPDRRAALDAYLEMPDGQVKSLQIMAFAGGNYTVNLSFPVSGKYIFELLVDTGSGLETAMLLPLYAGVPVDTIPTVLPQITDDRTAPSAMLLDLINRVRVQAKVSPLKRDARLDAVAQDHCADMARSGEFGHHSSRTGMLIDRLKVAALFPSLMAENVARSSTVFRAHSNLMRSPSHKIRLLRTDFTHIGVGVLSTGSDVLVTEILVRWEP